MTIHVEGMRTELSERSGKGVLGNLFSKITRLDLDGEKAETIAEQPSGNKS